MEIPGGLWYTVKKERSGVFPVKKRGWIIALVVVVVLAAAVLLFDSAYVLLNFQVVRRDAAEVTLTGSSLPWEFALKKLNGPQLLDLRQIPVTPEQHQRLEQLFPNAQLRYSIALGAQGVDMNATDLTLSATDVPQLPAALPTLPKLKQVTVDGEGADWELLKGLIAQYPAVDFDFALQVCGVPTRSTEDILDLGKTQVDIGELEQKLGCFTKLQRLLMPGCEEYEWLLALKEKAPELDVFYTLTVNDVPTDTHAASLALENVSLNTLQEALPHLKGLRELRLTGILPSDEELYKLMGQYPEVDFLWDVTVCGVAANTGDSKLILSETWMPNTDEVKEKLRYFCRLERVEMCYCGIPSDQMEALTLEFPQTRFVWAVRVGNGYLRTDANAFIPFKLGHDIDMPLYDKDCTELKYCIDLVCLDLGHMRMTDISFLEYMPKMQYLILGDTPVRDFTPIKGLTEMIYLEIFNCKFTDHSLLLGMTKLEDLNIGFTPAYDVETLKQLTWLKRLWLPAVPVSVAKYYELVEALPDTQVVKYVSHSTDGNWRDNDNYRAMRDLLGMFYMH